MKMNLMKNVNPFRIFAISGTIVAGTALIFNLISGVDFSETRIPYLEIIALCVNGLSVIAGIILICRPQ